TRPIPSRRRGECAQSLSHARAPVLYLLSFPSCFATASKTQRACHSARGASLTRQNCSRPLPLPQRLADPSIASLAPDAKERETTLAWLWQQAARCLRPRNSASVSSQSNPLCDRKKMLASKVKLTTCPASSQRSIVWRLRVL